MKQIAFFTCLLLSATLHARVMIYSLLDLAGQSDTVIAGQVMQVDKASAVVEVDTVLLGAPPRPRVTVSPITQQHCLGETVHFVAGERILLWARAAHDGSLVASGHGQGKQTLDPARADQQIAAARRLIEVAALKQDHARHRAMLAEADSDNPWLRRESHRYIASKIASSEQRQDYRDALVALLDDADADVQRAALAGLQFVSAEAAVPRMVELTRSADLSVVQQASLALARYDLPETVAALVALTQHTSADIRARAMIDLGNSRRLEARAALERRLYGDVRDRQMAPRALVGQLRAGTADALIPRLEALLQDPDPAVRASAAYALGETRNPAPVPALLAVIEPARTDPALADAAFLREILSSLYRHYSRNRPGARAAIEQQADTLITIMKEGSANDSFGPAFHAVGILSLMPTRQAADALRWARTNHPNAEIRGYADRSLAQRNGQHPD